MDLLQQRAAHAEDEICGRPTLRKHIFEDALYGFEANAVAPEKPDLGVEDFVTRTISCAAEPSGERRQQAQEHLDGITGIGAEDEQAIASEDLIAQDTAEHLLRGAVDVEAVD